MSGRFVGRSIKCAIVTSPFGDDDRYGLTFWVTLGVHYSRKVCVGFVDPRDRPSSSIMQRTSRTDQLRLPVTRCSVVITFQSHRRRDFHVRFGHVRRTNTDRMLFSCVLCLCVDVLQCVSLLVACVWVWVSHFIRISVV